MIRKEIAHYSDWLRLSIGEKNQYINKYWLGMEKDKKLKAAILEAFREKVKGRLLSIKKIYIGWHGFYSPTIYVELSAKQKVRLPQIFDIFEVRKIHNTENRDNRK